MTTKDVLSISAGVLFILGFVPYIRYILKNRHAEDEGKPMKTSWIIWAVLDSITISGMIATHSLNGQIVGAVIGAWIVVVLAFLYGKPGWRTVDKFCLGGAVVGIALMFISPTLAIVSSNSTVFLASIPTFVSTYEKPERENKTAWTIYWISCVMATVAIPQWDWDNATQPVTFLVIETIMMWLLWIRPRRLT